MRILQVVQSPQLRGAEVFAFGLSEKLRVLGHDVATVYLHRANGAGTLPILVGDQLLEGDAGSILRRFAGVSPRLLRRLTECIHRFRPDVVQVNGGSTVKYGAVVKRFSRRPEWVLVYRNIGDPSEWVRTLFQRVYYRNIVMPMVDGVVSVSRECLRQVVSVHAPDAITKVLPRGVDCLGLKACIDRQTIRERVSLPQDGLVLISVGSLSQEKRVDRLLRIFAKVSEQIKSSFLWIIGDGSKRSELERLAVDLGIADSVFFLGIRGDVASFLGAADLFVLASDTEGTPGVILEAGLMELPAVATKVGGVHACVVEGETGRLLNPEDEEGYAAAVVALLRDEARRKEMGARARRHVCENFSLDRIAVEYVDFYRATIATAHAKKELVAAG